MSFDGRSGRNLASFGDAARRALKENQIAQDALEPQRARLVWAEVVGDKLAGVCAAELVRGHTLFVRAKSSVWANELTFHKADILMRLNQRLAGPGGKADVITDIQFSSGSRRTRQATVIHVATASPEPVPLTLLPPLEPSSVGNSPDEEAMRARLSQLVERTRLTLEWKRENGWRECPRCSALYRPADSQSALGTASAGRGPQSLCALCRTIRNSGAPDLM